jgi:precorrin-2 dehydrogenase / sirohydrochlorin ferrochelatase
VPHTYPILLDVSAMKCLIVGGGRVAARKAAGLLAAGATDVTAVAPHFTADFPAVQKITALYDPSHLTGVHLVFAATDQPAVNGRVAADCRERRILVGRADDSGAGDFVTPAKLDVEHVTVTVSAGSAALATTIRDGLQQRWDPRWSRMAAAMQTLRPWVKSLPLSADERAKIFRKLASDEAMTVLERSGVDALRDWAIDRQS